ncbi:uncharacterized protein LOC124629043 [Ictalurus punctatus]|uniref:Uncharacterized protein LOC124629043 n=1 Tax=Ictalurus punctatus TaxID=7998 RepID=A0A9F7TRU5_ICTPU|nr:uncharacterized protein LOC124629043 [Ictalurus punctatus]
MEWLQPEEGARSTVTEQRLQAPLWYLIPTSPPSIRVNLPHPHLFSLTNNVAEVGREQHQQSGELEEDEIVHSCKPSSPTHHLSALLSGIQSDLRETLHLGPLEQKLLIVVGQAMPLSPLLSDPEDLEKLIKLGQIQAQDGTLTTNIIRNKFQ